MTQRLKLYKLNRIKGMSKYAAARAAGYSHNTAVAVKNNIEKRLSMSDLFEMAGITDSYISQYINERLQATKVIAADVFIKEEDGELKVNKNSNDWIEVPDYQAQHKFLETLLKLTNKIQSGTNIKIENNVKVNGNISSEQEQQQESYNTRLAKYFQE